MKKASFIGCFIVIVLGAVGGLYYLSKRIPDVAEQMPPNVSPVVVTLTTPLNDDAIPISDPTTISADAIGAEPIVTVELWVDGVRLFAKTSESGLNPFSATWSWTPPSEGAHTLIARATDAQLREGQSNVVRVVASRDAHPTTQVAYKTQSGDTIPVIAQKFKVPPQQVIDANPQINPNNPIPAGQDVSVPVPDPSEPGPGADNSTPEPPSSNPPPPSPDPGQGAPAGPPNKYIFWIKALANLFSKSSPPAKPDVAAVLGGCNVKLTIADHALNEDGFYVYRDGKKPSLKPIATLGAHDGATSFGYTDSDLAQDKYVYYVAAFNPAGDTLSNPVQVQVSDNKCKKDDILQMQDPILNTTQPMDKVYCYLRINSGDWQRIPHAPDTFLSPDTQGTFDASAYLSSLPINALKSQMTLDLDCWGWKENDLVYLGNAQETVGPGPVKVKADQFEFTGALPNLDLPNGPIPGFTPSPQQFLEGSVPSILPPSGLTNTHDSKVCAEHMPGPLALFGGGFACQEAITAGNYAVLVWDWLGGCWPGDSNCAPTIDGYRVYREDFPTPSLIKQVQGKDLSTAMFPLPIVPWPPGPGDSVMAKLKYQALSQNCYFARAFKDGVGESPDSNHVCLPLDAGVKSPKTLQIPAANWLTRYVYDEECGVTKGSAIHGKASSAGPQELEVGFYYSTEGCNFAWVGRGAVWFDLSAIPANAWITKSTLRYTLVKTDHTTDVASNAHYSCANRLMLGKEEWMGKDFGDQQYWIPGENYQNLPADVVGLNIAADVTGAVKEWVQGTHPNYGFVLRQSEEGMHTDWDSVCTSIYKDLALEVTYTPKQ